MPSESVVSAKVKAVVHRADGGYRAEIPALPDCSAQGRTLAELRRNLQAAVDRFQDDHNSEASDRGDEPNELTRKTMLNARSGRDVVRPKDKAELFRKLGL